MTLSGILGVSGEEGGFMDALAEARLRLEAVAGVDRELDKISQQLQNSFYELEETGRAARDYAEAVDLDARRLTEIEERLELINQLKRKYGPTVEEVLKYADSARQRLALLTSAEADRSGLEDDLKKTTSTAIELALKLRQLRQKAAKELEAQAGTHLQDLAFHDCGFEVRLFPLEGEKKLPPAATLTRSGLDAVEFYVSLNPGMPAAPLKETASGGELSRIMLAIKSTVAVDEAVTFVFDEIDAGIGGETGSAVGAKLKKLADHSQIICITHLPQIACYADAHFSVVKSSKGGKTVTTVTQLNKEDVVGELCRMMGSHPGNEKAREHAVSLLEKVSK
jgi:DNA repair protein RecN (Recombination protein N)